MKADGIKGLARLGDECGSVGRHIARLLERARELADQMPAPTPDERDETIAEALRFVGEEILHGIGPRSAGTFRKAIER